MLSTVTTNMAPVLAQKATLRHITDQNDALRQHIHCSGVGVCMLFETSDRTHLHATAQAQHQVQRRLLLDVVVGQGAAILQLLAGKNQALLVRRNALL